MIKHIAFIMDGNRRYSKEKKLPINEGYNSGFEKFLEIIKYQIKYNIFETSYFALSSDNYKKRSNFEKLILFNLIKKFSTNENIENFFIKNKIKVEIKGEISQIKENEKKDKNNLFLSELESKLNKINKKNETHKFKVNICLNYDGQKEILYSLKKIIKKIKSNKLNINEITEETIKKNIYFSDSTPPEIIVRPGNAPRTSGFMLWDSKYSEIYLTKKYWPELNEEDFKEILLWFKNQKRNFGS